MQGVSLPGVRPVLANMASGFSRHGQTDSTLGLAHYQSYSVGYDYGGEVNNTDLLHLYIFYVLIVVYSIEP